MEEWRAIVGYEGRYEVSDLGNIRSLVSRFGPRKVPRPVRTRRAKYRGRYFVVKLRNESGLKGNAGQDDCYVHLLVLTAFKGPRPPRMQAAHENGDLSDNSAANLSWKTPVDNNADKRRHGTLQHGERCYNAKLTEADVRAIRARYKRYSRGPDSLPGLAAEFGVSAATVKSVVARKAWAHVQENP